MDLEDMLVKGVRERQTLHIIIYMQNQKIIEMNVYSKIETYSQIGRTNQ